LISYNNPGPADDDVPPAPSIRTPEEVFNARLGIGLFLLYLAIYAGFVLLSAFKPDEMSKPLDIFGGLNVAIAYGMGLILAALLLAAVYILKCKPVVEESK
jgi:uncharacterized membrane protein (DUF485 family)